MTSDDEKYGLNRHLWRKTYGYNRQKPRIIQYFDSGSQTSASLDQTKTFRHRDTFIIRGVNRNAGGFELPTGSLGTSSYEEGLVAFNNECEKTFTFSNPFATTPIVVFTVESTINDSDNINVFGHALPSTTGANISVSAPFTGNVRYRAASIGGPFAASTAFTGSFQYFAGYIDLTNSMDYTASYTIPAGTLEFRASFHEHPTNAECNTGDIKDSVGASASEHSLTMETTSRIHFIVTN